MTQQPALQVEAEPVNEGHLAFWFHGDSRASLTPVQRSSCLGGQARLCIPATGLPPCAKPITAAMEVKVGSSVCLTRSGTFPAEN